MCLDDYAICAHFVSIKHSYTAVHQLICLSFMISIMFLKFRQLISEYLMLDTSTTRTRITVLIPGISPGLGLSDGIRTHTP